MTNADFNADSDNAKDTGRAEAFSDGVIAIAITLLAFNLRVPTSEDAEAAGGLLQALAQNWTAYLAFFTSFMVILIMWVNHHRLFRMIHRTDHNFLMINGLLLMGITVVPFATILVADYLTKPEANIAVAVYTGLSLILSFLFQAFWRYAAYKRRLLGANVPDEAIKAVYRQFWVGPVGYAIALLLSFVNAFLGFGVILLLAIWFALPSRRSENVKV
jgi:uncharacterized membrane protein